MGETIRRPMRVVVVGSANRPEFRDVAEWIRAHCEVQFTEDIASARDLLRVADRWIEFVFLLQSRPGLWCEADIESLNESSPLTRLITVLGSWCEGEARSGNPLAGVRRIPWCHFVAYMEMERSENSDAAFPRTFADLERSIVSNRHSSALIRPDVEAPAGECLVSAIDREDFLMISDSINQFGLKCHRFVGDMSPNRIDNFRFQLGIFSVDRSIESDRSQLERLAEFRRMIAPARVVAISGFVRCDDRDYLRRLGIIDVFSKPLQYADWKSIAACKSSTTALICGVDRPQRF